jgi:hypothetical protein
MQIVNHWQGRQCQMPVYFFAWLVRPLWVVAPPFDGAKSCRLEENMIIDTNCKEVSRGCEPLYPLRLSERRSVERMVINNSASFALGSLNSRRFREVATLNNINATLRCVTLFLLTHTCPAVSFLQAIIEWLQYQTVLLRRMHHPCERVVTRQMSMIL